MNAGSPKTDKEREFRTVSGILLDIDRFELLCEYLNMKRSRLSEEAGLDKGFLGRLYRNEVNSILDESLHKIAEYAGLPKNFFYAEAETNHGCEYGWHVLGRYDFEVNYRFLERTRNLRRLITINDDLSSYLVPDDYVKSVYTERFASWGFPPAEVDLRVKDMLEVCRRRAESRNIGVYTHYIICPVSAVKNIARRADTWVKALEDNVIVHQDLTALGLVVDPKKWSELQSAVSEKIPWFLKGWRQITIAGDVYCAVWKEAQMWFSCHPPVVKALHKFVKDNVRAWMNPYFSLDDKYPVDKIRQWNQFIGIDELKRLIDWFVANPDEDSKDRIPLPPQS